jgi:predicted DNA-binding transcriptional regulator YafY
MPQIELTGDELRDACMALRAAAHRATQDAKAMAQSSKDHGFADTARRYAALCEKFEATRHAR